MEAKEAILEYLHEQINNTDFLTQAYIKDEYGQQNPFRNSYHELTEHLNNFLNNDSSARFFLLPGLRGTGKTTILSQLYSSGFECGKDVHKLFLSVDKISRILNVSLYEVLEAYQSIIDSSFERLEKPLVIFLDEVHYDEKWDITLKILFDRSNKIFVFATGSSALSLNSSPDLARRSVLHKVLPLSFIEYVKIKDGVELRDPALQKELRTIIFESENAEGLFNSLKNLENQFFAIGTKYESLEIDRYLRYCTLPFVLSLKNEALAYNQINDTILKIINIDLATHTKFSKEVLATIPKILYTIADSEQLVLSNLSTYLGISRQKIAEILDKLIQSELINEIYSYESHMTRVKKSSRYFFAAPAIRSMYYNFYGSAKFNYTGKLLEDLIVMYLNRLPYKAIGASINFDNNRNAADFIYNFANQRIVLEVGSGKKDFGQVSKTLEKVKDAKYGLNISRSPLALSKDKNSVSLPLEYFLLL